MEELRKKAYRKLLKHLVDSGRALLYHKQHYNPEYAALMGDFCYLMHNLVNTNYKDDWIGFHEDGFWETFEFLKEKSPYKDRFESLKKDFLNALVNSDEANVPSYLLPVFRIIKKSFGPEINQHQYEGLIVFLYDYMNLRNIGKLLSYFYDKHEVVITADIDKYYNADKSTYDEVKEQLDKNGFIQWSSAFDFQVNNSFIKNGILYVEGRFIEGQLIRIGDNIYTIRTKDKIESVNMKVVSIEMYDRHVEFLGLGMTARLGLEIDKRYKIEENTVLSSENI